MTVIASTKKMTFPLAMEKVIKGEKITRLEWNDPATYGCMADGFLMIRNSEKPFKLDGWLVGDGDLLADDWVVVE